MRNIFNTLFLIALLSGLPGCFVVKVNLGPEAQPLEEEAIAGQGKDKIVLMDLSGTITSEENGSLVGGAKEPGMLARIREQLDKARLDRNVKAVVLRINSPGGGVTASDMLYHELKTFRRDTGVKIIAHFIDLGTSGAYYTALAADRITAQPTSITGSIGVTMLRVDASGLMQKIGIQALEISSGAEKGMGSPFRPMSAEEKGIFQRMIDSMYGRFVSVVSEERKMPADRVRQLADGRIYTSQEAKASGLIDGIGYLDDAFDQARGLAHLERATIVTYHRPGDYRPNVYSMSMTLFNLNLGELAGPGLKFTYLWMP
jgi:protease-4